VRFVSVATVAARDRGLDPEWPPVLVALVLFVAVAVAVSVVVVFRALRNETRGSRTRRSPGRRSRPRRAG
jgi:hypothetical protein